MQSHLTIVGSDQGFIQRKQDRPSLDSWTLGLFDLILSLIFSYFLLHSPTSYLFLLPLGLVWFGLVMYGMVWRGCQMTSEFICKEISMLSTLPLTSSHLLLIPPSYSTLLPNLLLTPPTTSTRVSDD